MHLVIQAERVYEHFLAGRYTADAPCDELLAEIAYQAILATGHEADWGRRRFSSHTGMTDWKARQVIRLAHTNAFLPLPSQKPPSTSPAFLPADAVMARFSGPDPSTLPPEFLPLPSQKPPSRARASNTYSIINTSSSDLNPTNNISSLREERVRGITDSASLESVADRGIEPGAGTVADRGNGEGTAGKREVGDRGENTGTGTKTGSGIAPTPSRRARPQLRLDIAPSAGRPPRTATTPAAQSCERSLPPVTADDEPVSLLAEPAREDAVPPMEESQQGTSTPTKRRTGKAKPMLEERFKNSSLVKLWSSLWYGTECQRKPADPDVFSLVADSLVAFSEAHGQPAALDARGYNTVRMTAQAWITSGAPRDQYIDGARAPADTYWKEQGKYTFIRLFGSMDNLQAAIARRKAAAQPVKRLPDIRKGQTYYIHDEMPEVREL